MFYSSPEYLTAIWLGQDRRWYVGIWHIAIIVLTTYFATLRAPGKIFDELSSNERKSEASGHDFSLVLGE